MKELYPHETDTDPNKITINLYNVCLTENDIQGLLLARKFVKDYRESVGTALYKLQGEKHKKQNQFNADTELAINTIKKIINTTF